METRKNIKEITAPTGRKADLEELKIRVKEEKNRMNVIIENEKGIKMYQQGYELDCEMIEVDKLKAAFIRDHPVDWDKEEGWGVLIKREMKNRLFNLCMKQKSLKSNVDRKIGDFKTQILDLQKELPIIRERVKFLKKSIGKTTKEEKATLE